MKTKLLISAAVAGIFLTPALAKSNDEPLFTARELSFDVSGQYVTRASSLTEEFSGGKFGGGLGVNYFFFDWLGLGADIQIGDNGGKFIDSSVANVILRAPLETLRIAPYIFGGGGMQFERETSWAMDAGAGVDFRVTHRFGIFADARYVWADKNPDYGLIRAGFRFAF